MLILAFDTTSPHGGAALYDNSELLAQVEPEGSESYSIALFEMLERLLLKTGAHLPEVELFAAATGPGSFTGIRVGLAAAQGWAKALERRVCGVSVLEAMVEAARPRGQTAVPLLDARRGEFYVGIFRRRASAGEVKTADADFSLSGEGRALDAPRIAALLDELTPDAGAGVTVIATEHDRAAVELLARVPPIFERTTVPGRLAGPVARVALRAAREGRLQRPEELNAWYIRRSDAELHWRE